MRDDFTRFRMTWLDQIYDDAQLTPAARDIAFRISRLFNRKRYSESGACTAWPSYETLAKDAGCASKTVQRCVGLLKARGHLATQGNGGRHCTLTYYAIVRASEKLPEDEITATKGGHASPPLSKSTPADLQKVDIQSPKGGHLTTEKVDTGVLQTSLNKPLMKSLMSSPARETVEQSTARAPTAVIVLSILAQGPGKLPQLAPCFRGKEAEFPDIVNAHRAEHGWPDIEQQCRDPERWSLGLAKMAFEMEPVASVSGLWADWKAEYRSRGWPMPKPLDGIACFPPGGPKKLGAFLDRIKATMRDEAVSSSSNVVRMLAAR